MDAQEAPKRNKAAARHPNGRIDREQSPLWPRGGQAVASEIGAPRTGFHISPSAPIGGLLEGNEAGDLYGHLITELDKLKLTYLHWPRKSGARYPRALSNP